MRQKDSDGKRRITLGRERKSGISKNDIKYIDRNKKKRKETARQIQKVTAEM